MAYRRWVKTLDRKEREQLSNQITPVWAEINHKGESIAFTFDWPGACGWGSSLEVAMSKLESDVAFTRKWLGTHRLELEPDLDPGYPLRVIEKVEATGNPLECDSEGFFSWDAVPCDNSELEATQRLLDCSRGNLLALASGLPDALLDLRLVEGKRTVREIIDHIASAEWWYTTRILPEPSTAKSWETFGEGAFERLDAIRKMFENEYLARLGDMPDSERLRIFSHMGERWNARKTLRRAVWHELLHYKQLTRLIPKIRGFNARDLFGIA